MGLASAAISSESPWDGNGGNISTSATSFPSPQKKYVWNLAEIQENKGLTKNMSDNRKLPKFGAKNQVNVRVYQKNIAPSKWYVKFQPKPA